MYNYQNTRIETKKGQFKPPSQRIVQALRKKELSESEIKAQDIVTLHRSLQRIIVKEVNKNQVFEKTKFLPNSCEDQYFTAIDPVEMEDYSKIYQNLQQILQMDPEKIKRAKEVVDHQLQEKQKQKSLFENQEKEYKFSRQNIVKQRMQSILDKHNKHQNGGNNNNAPKKEEAHLKPHDQRVLNHLSDMYSNEPQSVKNATTVQKVVSNLSAFESTRNNLISQTKVPYQQIIRHSNNSVLMARHKKRSSTSISSDTNINSSQKVQNIQSQQNTQTYSVEPNVPQQTVTENNRIKITTLNNSIDCNQNEDLYGKFARSHSVTVPTATPKTQFKKFQPYDQDLLESDNQTYYNPAHTTLQSTMNQSRIKQMNNTVSPNYYSSAQKWLSNLSPRDDFKLRNTTSLNKINQRTNSIKRDNSNKSYISQEKYPLNQKSMVQQKSTSNIDGLYLTACIQKTEIDENDKNQININKRQRTSCSIDPFGNATKHTTTQNTKQNTQPASERYPVKKKEKVKQRNPMKQYYDVDADRPKDGERLQYSLDVPFDQFQRNFNISLHDGKPKKALIDIPSLEKELKLKGIKRQQEEQQKRYKMNLNLNQLEEFKGFKFPLNESQVVPTKNAHNGRVTSGLNSTSLNVINGNQSVIGIQPSSATHSRKNTFNVFYKGQTSLILQNKKKSPSPSFQNLSIQNSVPMSKEQSLLIKPNLVSVENGKSLAISPSPSKFQQLQFGMNIQDFNQSELLLLPSGLQSKKQSNIQNIQDLNTSGFKLKLNESPLHTGRTRSNDNTTKGNKQSILIKRDNLGKSGTLQNQVSFVLSDSPQTISVSQNYLNDRMSPIKDIKANEQQHYQQQHVPSLHLDQKSYNLIPHDQMLTQRKNNNSVNQNIIYEYSDMNTSQIKNSKTQFFSQPASQLVGNKKVEGVKTDEMKINENQKRIEKMKSIKFKKLVSRTHQCEDRVIDGCRSFYVKKKEKNQELFQLFLTHYRDRPKTQEIRSRNYTCNASTQMSRFNLRAARENSENDRIHLTKMNEPQQLFYKQLVSKLIMKSNSGDNMSICVYVMNAFKTILEDLDFFQAHHLFELLKNVEEKDTFFYNPTSYFMVTTIMDHLTIAFHEIMQYKKLSSFVSYYQNLETEQQNTQSTINQENQQKPIATDTMQITIQNEDTIEDFEDDQD